MSLWKSIFMYWYHSNKPISEPPLSLAEPPDIRAEKRLLAFPVSKNILRFFSEIGSLASPSWIVSTPSCLRMDLAWKNKFSGTKISKYPGSPLASRVFERIFGMIGNWVPSLIKATDFASIPPWRRFSISCSASSIWNNPMIS